MHVSFKSSLLTGLTLAVLSAPLYAQQTIWTIGAFNASSGEFGRNGIDYAQPSSDVNFTVAKSTLSDWHAFQPGPANGLTGGRKHPYTIRFILSESPKGEYALHLAVLYETPRLSYLNIQINGHNGNVFFHPKLDFHAGDWEGTFVPQTSIDDRTVAIPARFLQQGENVLVFTAVDDPSTLENSTGAIAPGHTGLTWDALELRQMEHSHTQPHAEITPSIFYKKHGDTLTEEVEVVTHNLAIHAGEKVELSAGNTHQSQAANETIEFGDTRTLFDVPEWKGPLRARVRANKWQSSTQNLQPAKKWTIAIVPHEHLDIGFTDYAAKVAELHSQSIDQAMDLMEKHPEFRWTLDGSWVADMYLRGRDSASRERFLQHVRDGSVVIPPEFANQHTGNASWEALAQSLYGRERLSRKYHLPSTDTAQIVDVPSYTWGYASLLHDAGIRYFAAASNGWRAPVTLLGRWNEKSPFYWEGPDGSRVLMWYSRAYLQAHTLFGGPWRISAVHDALPVFLQAYTRPDYTANTAIIFGTQLENTALEKEQSEIVEDVSKVYAWPKLEFATVHSAMQQIEKTWQGQIPVYRGDFGPYWEDGYGSDAIHTALHRQNQHRITTAEIMGSAATATSLHTKPNKSQLEDAWQNELLFDEHTWTHVSSTTDALTDQTRTQTALKQSRATRAANDITESIQRSWAQLEAHIRPSENSVAVFNALNWTRSGYVDIDLPQNFGLKDATTGTPVPMEVLSEGAGLTLPGFGGPSHRVRFLAKDIPAVGYKLFTIVLAPASKVPQHASGNSIENAFYKVVFDEKSGAIASIIDKQTNRELVDTSSPYRFGSYLYVTGGDNYPHNSLYRFGAGLNPPQLATHTQQRTRDIETYTSDLSVDAVSYSKDEQTPTIETRVTLPKDRKAILLTVKLHKDATLHREAAYIAFPFAMQSPHFTYSSQTGWIDPAKDELTGGSREWYSVTGWAAVSNHNATAAVIPLDAPLMCFGDMMRGAWPTEFRPKSSTIFSWLMNNYWATNFPPMQGGDYTFRYAIVSSDHLDPAQLSVTSSDLLTPLEHDSVAQAFEQDTTPLPATSASLLTIDTPNVSLLTWKQAEDEDGSILRIQEHAGKSSTVRISSNAFKINRAWLTDVLERNTKEIDPTPLQVEIKPFQVLTLRIRTTTGARQ